MGGEGSRRKLSNDRRDSVAPGATGRRVAECAKTSHGDGIVDRECCLVYTHCCQIHDCFAPCFVPFFVAKSESWVWCESCGGPCASVRTGSGPRCGDARAATRQPSQQPLSIQQLARVSASTLSTSQISLKSDQLYLQLHHGSVDPVQGRAVVPPGRDQHGRVCTRARVSGYSSWLRAYS